jgi:general secretion pathway protein I
MMRLGCRDRRRPCRGFTLLEVLVALVVLAIAMAALIKGGAENARSAAYLRDKTLAQWVAMNVIAEQRLADEWPSAQTRRGSEEMGGHEWFWQLKVVETFDEDVRRLEVAVRGEENRELAPLVNLVAFLPRPAAQGGATAAPVSGAPLNGAGQ